RLTGLRGSEEPGGRLSVVRTSRMANSFEFLCTALRGCPWALPAHLLAAPRVASRGALLTRFRYRVPLTRLPCRISARSARGIGPCRCNSVRADRRMHGLEVEGGGLQLQQLGRRLSLFWNQKESPATRKEAGTGSAGQGG